MANPFENSNSVFPEITRAVEVAYDENAVKTDSDAPDINELSGSDVDAVKQQSGNILEFDLGVEAIENPETAAKFEKAFQEYDKLFKRVGLNIPTPDDFNVSQVNFTNLATSFEQMESDDLVPNIIITPALSIASTINAKQATTWDDLYKKLLDDPGVSDKYLAGNQDGSGISHGDVTNDENASLLDQETNLIKTKPGVHSVSQDGLLWTIAVLPGTQRTTQPKSPNNGDSAEDEEYFASYETISQYLSLQACRIQQGLPPIDMGTSTWLYGKSTNAEGNRVAPVASWSEFEIIDASGKMRNNSAKNIKINTCYYKTVNVPQWGVRIPIWG